MRLLWSHFGGSLPVQVPKNCNSPLSAAAWTCFNSRDARKTNSHPCRQRPRCLVRDLLFFWLSFSACFPSSLSLPPPSLYLFPVLLYFPQPQARTSWGLLLPKEGRINLYTHVCTQTHIYQQTLSKPITFVYKKTQVCVCVRQVGVSTCCSICRVGSFGGNFAHRVFLLVCTLLSRAQGCCPASPGSAAACETEHVTYSLCECVSV